MTVRWRVVLVIALSGLLLTGSSTAHSSFLSDDIFVPSVGRGAGAEGSHWYTTVWFHNPGSEDAVVTVEMLLRDQANPTPESQTVTVPSGSTLTFKDAINDLFGLESAVGAFRVRTSVPIAVGARVFNQPGADVADSQGQLMAGIPARVSIGPDGMVEVPGILQPADDGFRSNFGLVETSGENAEVKVTLLDGTGVELGSKRFSLGPFAALQRSLATTFPNVTVDGGILRVEVTGSTGAVLAYASAVGNGAQSQDPTTLDMTLDPLVFDVPGITSIEAGPGLAGGGSEGVVELQVRAGEGIQVSSSGVSIKDGGITAEHIADGEVVLGAKVGNETLTDVITLQAGANVDLEVDGNKVVFSAFGCFGERQELPLSQGFVANSAGNWVAGNDQLYLAAAGRWRIGYRVLVQISNTGYATVSDPVNIALVDATEGEVIRSTISVVGQKVDLNTSIFATVSGETIVDVDRPTSIVLAARTSRNDLSVSIHPNSYNLSPSLPDPDGASFLFSECIDLDG